MTPAHVIPLMVTLFVLVVGIDIWLALDDRKGNTYSEIVRDAGKVWPFTRLLMALAMGVLLGHWYW